MEEKNDIIDTKIDPSELDALASHYSKALDAIKIKDFVKANEELDYIFRLNPNSPYYYIAKLLIEFGFSTVEELQEKANNDVIASPYFKKAEEFSDLKTKQFLQSLKKEISVKDNKEKLKKAPLDQLLRLLKVQKENNIDGSLTLQMILNKAYKSYRYLSKEFVEENGMETTFISQLNTINSNFHKSIDELNEYRDIKEIESIINISVQEKDEVDKYLLTYFSINLDAYQEKGMLIEIKNYLLENYKNNEAEALLMKIDSLLSLTVSRTKGKHLGLIISTAVTGALIVCLAAGALTYYFLTNSTTINGVKYTKNGSGGYTISEISNEYLEANNGIIYLESKVLDREVNEIDRNAFYESSVKEIKNFPTYVISIPDNAFFGAKNLTRIEINTTSNLEVIGDSAFEDCPLLSTISLPSNLKTIGAKAFEGCTSLNNLTIPTTVTEIGVNAFKDTDKLINLTSNSSTKFDGATVGLKSRTISYDQILEKGEYIGAKPISYYAWDTIVLPDFKTNADYLKFADYTISNSDGTKTLNEIKAGQEVKVSGFDEINVGASYEYEKKFVENYVVYELADDGSHFIITGIEKDESTTIREISLKSSFGALKVSEIAPNAFKGNTEITSISNFPSSITKIPDYCFQDCTSLTKVEFEDKNNSKLESIGTEAFKNCTSLEKVIIPAGVSSIGSQAFANTPNLLDFNNLSGKNFKGEDLGLTKRTITFDYNGTVVNGSPSVNSYYVSDGKVKIQLPGAENKRIVKINGTTAIGKTEHTFETNNKSSYNVSIVYEGYYDKNIIGNNDGKYGVSITNSSPSFFVNETITFDIVIAGNRDVTNGTRLDISMFNYDLSITNKNGSAVEYSEDKTTGKVTLKSGTSIDTFNIKVEIRTKYSNELIDETTEKIEIVERLVKK